MDQSKKSKIVEFHKNNPTLSKVIIGSTGLLRKITGKDSAYRKQEIENKREQASLNSILSSKSSLNKSSTSILVNKISSLDSKSSGDLREKMVNRLRSDLKLKKSMMNLSTLTESPRKMSNSSASSKKSSASSKKSSASSKKSSASSKKSSYVSGPLKPQRIRTYYLPY